MCVKNLSADFVEVTGKERRAVGMKRLEIVGALMSGIRREEMTGFVVGVAPHNNVCRGPLLDGGEEYLGPPCRHCHAFESGFGKRHKFAAVICRACCRSECRGHGHTILVNTFFSIVCVHIRTHNIHKLIAGVSRDTGHRLSLCRASKPRAHCRPLPHP